MTRRNKRSCSLFAEPAEEVSHPPGRPSPRALLVAGHVRQSVCNRRDRRRLLVPRWSIKILGIERSVNRTIRTSSRGKLLALSLVSTLAVAMLFQPLLMGSPHEHS